MDKQLSLGKVDMRTLRHSVLPYMPLYKEPTLDAVGVEIRGKAMVSHNPALGVPLETLGFFAFHYAASNLAMRFAHPKYIMVGINLPPKSTEEDLTVIAKSLGGEAKRYGVEVAGGHAGVYKGLSIPLVSVTCLGRQMRKPASPSPGDIMVIIGAVGAEAAWLGSLSGRISTLSEGDGPWRRLTPLPPSLRLMSAKGVKVMHDVSEGGVAGALYEMAENISLKLDVKSGSIPYHEDAKKLAEDLLRIPSYGVLIAIVNEPTLEQISRLCKEIGYPCSAVGRTEKGSGAYVDGARIKGVQRTKLDENYGLFEKKQDETIAKLSEALLSLERYADVSKIIPEVGTNMVYSKRQPESLGDIAGLSGRVVVSLGRPKVCGEVVYGGSKYLGSVLIEAGRLNPETRAAVNVKGGENVTQALESIGIEVCTLPAIATEDTCPITAFIRNSREFSYAYYHPGSHGIEPSTVILSRNPEALLDLLIKASEHVRDNKLV